MMKTLLLANLKGGVGKSAIATQIAYYFHDVLKQRVLFIDMDHQGNSSKAIKASGLATVSQNTSYALLTKDIEIEKESFLLLAADPNLSMLERQPKDHNDYANRLAERIKSLENDFDVCVIDVNPNPDIRLTVSLVSADYVLSPIQLNQEAVDGIGAMLNDPKRGIRSVQANWNKGLQFLGLLPNLVEPTPFQRQNLVDLAKAYAKFMFIIGGKPANIPRRTAVAEAQAEGKPIWRLSSIGSDGKERPRTSARDAWKEIKPVFDEIARRMEIAPVKGN